MEKDGGGLWDDSALVDAFDHALNNYKVMHTFADNAQTLKEGSCNNSNEDVQEEIDGNPNAPLDQTTFSSFSIDETHGKSLDLHQGQKSCISQQSSGISQEKACESSDAASVEYSQLLGHYYELQSQQQKVLDQLYQTSYWNNQILSPHYTTTAHEVHNSTCTPQLPSSSCFSGSQPSFLGNQPSSAAYPCHPGTCIPWPMSPPCLSGCQAYQEPKGNNKDEETEKREAAGTSRPEQGLEFQNNIMDTVDPDLSAVIGAWYSAGFYTGRYLLQQTLKKDRQ